ncbi:MAG: ribokinase [Subtercola sp.]|jgi:fructokinase|nr:ribokinase [Subtercola sp.]
MIRRTRNESGPSSEVTPVIVIGEALIDIVVDREGSTEHPGGSPMNVAIGLGRLGNDVHFVTRIGNDARGAELKHHADQSGVTFFPGSIVDEATSTATARLDEAGAARYEFDICWSLDFVDRLPPIALVHTGSIAAFVSPGATDVRRLLADTSESTIVTFDPNIRPSLLRSPVEERRTAEDLMSLSNVVKLSDEDAQWLYPGCALSDVLDHIRSLGPALAIITKGESGAILASGRAIVDLPGRSVRVADTIGAGDSFMSAVIHALLRLLRENTSPETIRDGSALTLAALTKIGTFAIECAALTVSRVGADPPRLADTVS